MFAQDVLLRLNRHVFEPAESPRNDKVVLALNLKGRFDNVIHEVILPYL